MPPKVIDVAAAGPIPSIRFIAGFAQLGQYSLYLWDANARNPVKVGTGNTGDRIKDVFPLVASAAQLAKLEGFYLSWVVWIHALNRRAGAQWSFDLVMEQGGQTVEREKRKGPMDSSFKHFKGAWRIHLV